MIRLYTQEEIRPGARIRLTPEEVRYYKTVRRAQGGLCLFNRSGQEAKGKVEGSDFVVESVSWNSAKAYPLHIAVGLPDAKVVKELIASCSELGVRSLRFFPAERSQGAKARLKEAHKWSKWAIESMRQCARAEPLLVENTTFHDLLIQSECVVFYLDEKDLGNRREASVDRSAKVLLVIGPEGGWSEQERGAFEAAGFNGLHFPLPVMRVGTAALCAASIFLSRLWK